MHGRLWIMCCMFGTLAGIAQAESQDDHKTVDQGWLVKITTSCFRMSVPVKWQEEQAICCAGLTKPKPNVCQQAVQYLLVVCTTVEVRNQGALSVLLLLLPHQASDICVLHQCSERFNNAQICQGSIHAKLMCSDRRRCWCRLPLLESI